jgi:hypothetical protein
MNKKTVFFALAGLLILVCAAWATFPATMNYQGILKDQNSNAITGTKSMTFKIYNESSGGSALWTETQNVTITSGLFNVILGSVTPINSSVYSDGLNKYLGIKVESDSEMTPRSQILPVIYAYHALVADSVTGGSIASATYATLSGTATNASYSSLSGTATLAAYSNFSGVATIAAYSNLSGMATIAAYSISTGIATTSAYATLSGTATNAGYAVLSGSASTAATVNGISASTEAIANKLLALDANKQFKGMAVSAEASGNNYAMFINSGKIGVKAGSNMAVGTGTITSGNNSVSVSNTQVTDSSVILLTVNSAVSNNNGGIRVSSVTSSVGFAVSTMSNDPVADNTSFWYLIIN